MQFGKSILLGLICFLLFDSSVLAQELLPNGGSEVDVSIEECISPEKALEIEMILQGQVKLLREKGILTSEDIQKTVLVTDFSWPLQQASTSSQSDYYITVNYTDQNVGPVVEDYNCGNRSYDGHKGLDLSLWPYWWKMMNENQVEVIAAAPGTIIFKQDGKFDMRCSCIGSWNAVYVQHADGSIAWYGHLKKNSLTSLTVGESIETGDFIGLVGSSGCSSNPHLHFEVHDADNNVIDPYFGDCNVKNEETWWTEQKPYLEPAINLLMTHSVAPNFNGFCPEDEEPGFEYSFEPGNPVIFAVYYRDQEIDSVTDFLIKDADGIVQNDWSFTSPSTYNASYWYWEYIIPQNAVSGDWTFEADFADKHIVHTFQIEGAVNTNNSYDQQELVEIFPNPVYESLKINVAGTGRKQAVLLTISGDEIFTCNFQSSYSADMTNVKPGMYFLRIIDLRTKVIIVKKIVVD